MLLKPVRSKCTQVYATVVQEATQLHFYEQKCTSINFKFIDKKYLELKSELLYGIAPLKKVKQDRSSLILSKIKRFFYRK